MAEVSWDQYDAALFDLDGVVTPDCRGAHARVVGDVQRLSRRAGSASGSGQPPYTDQDYYDYVDGKPRYDGVRTFLLARGITLPEGEPSDPPEAETVAGLGNRKNLYFGKVLDEEGVEAYPGSVRLLDALRERGMPMAIVSSSRNAPAVLAAAGVSDYFDTVMHGGVAAERHLAGKPAPDTFLAAATDLGATAERAVVLEDASAASAPAPPATSASSSASTAAPVSTLSPRPVPTWWSPTSPSSFHAAKGQAQA